MRRRANTDSAEVLQMHRRLRWIGHVIRMCLNRLPRRILYVELCCGQRLYDRSLKRFQDHTKGVRANCDIPHSSLETTATDRLYKWTNKADLVTFLSVLIMLLNIAVHEDTRQPVCRHRVHSGRVCASQFGLCISSSSPHSTSFLVIRHR